MPVKRFVWQKLHSTNDSAMLHIYSIRNIRENPMKNGVITPIPLNPYIQTLIERGDQAGNIPISGNTPEEFEASFNRAFLMLKSNKVSLNSPAPEAEIMTAEAL